MDPRARRQVLHEHLSRARAHWERGDQPAALRAVEDALRLDPDFLAAQALRDHIARGDAPTRVASPASRTDPSPAPPAAASGGLRPAVGPEGWARFEQRARLRHIDKRAEAARTAIELGRFSDAAAAIEQIRAIDATHPDIISLGMELDAAEQLAAADRRASRPRTHVGPVMAAFGVFAALLFGARWFETPAPREGSTAAQTPTPVSSAPASSAAPRELSRNGVPPSWKPETGTVEPAVAPAEAAVMPSLDAPATAVDRAGADAAPLDQPVTPQRAPIIWPPATTSVAPPQAPAGVPEWSGGAAHGADGPAPRSTVAPGVVSPPLTAGTPARVVAADTIAPPAPAGGAQPDVALASTLRAASTAVPTMRDEELVRRVLQHYRLAYDTLDARAAQSVWPAVNATVLQRAFDGLVSQQLTFANCDIQVRGETGTAVCQGSARYVPKLGSREARVEPRVWSFGLRKTGSDWQIESARTER